MAGCRGADLQLPSSSHKPVPHSPTSTHESPDTPPLLVSTMFLPRSLPSLHGLPPPFLQMPSLVLTWHSWWHLAAGS